MKTKGAYSIWRKVNGWRNRRRTARHRKSSADYVSSRVKNSLLHFRGANELMWTEKACNPDYRDLVRIISFLLSLSCHVPPVLSLVMAYVFQNLIMFNRQLSLNNGHWWWPRPSRVRLDNTLGMDGTKDWIIQLIISLTQLYICIPMRLIKWNFVSNVKSKYLFLLLHHGEKELSKTMHWKKPCI